MSYIMINNGNFVIKEKLMHDDFISGCKCNCPRDCSRSNMLAHSYRMRRLMYIQLKGLSPKVSLKQNRIC